MGGFFTVAALAVASSRANTVGAVRLTCTWEGLDVELVRGGRYAAGFAPAALAEAVRFTVPYRAVRGLVREGSALCLAFDPAIVTPHNRFVLTHFRTDAVETLGQAHAARRAVTAAAYALPIPIGILAAALVPRSLVGGALGWACIAVLTAAAAFALLRLVADVVSWGGRASDRFRDAFETELSRRLGLAPAPLEVGSPFVAPTLDQLAAAAPQSRSAWGVAIATVLVVGGIAFVERFGGPTEPPPVVATLEAGRLGGAAAPARAFADHERAEYQRCICMRADSPLWNDGVPALSILLSSRREGVEVVRPNVDARGVPRYDFDLAVVNNASEPQHDVRVVVTFMRHKEGGEVGVKERGLFWEGELLPGKSVKWRVRAPGDTMRIVSSVPQMLGGDGGEDPEEPAPADAFVALASAKRRPVRVHAAMMLAYLRDPRAARAVDLLRESAGPVEVETLARIARASRPIIACDVRARGGELDACVFNGSAAPVRGFDVREISADSANEEAHGASELSPRSWSASASVPVHEGVRMHFKLDGTAPSEVEVVPHE